MLIPGVGGVNNLDQSAPLRDAAGAARALVAGMRPRQWTKNLIILFALLFSVGEAWSPAAPSEAAPLIIRAVLALALFCALSGGVYLLNDAADSARDRVHPRKRTRPVAAGRISARSAASAGAVVTAASVALGFVLEPALGWVALGYAALTVAYSAALRRIVLVDVFAIAAGFVLRAVAGAAALGVPVSPWLYTCTGLGALVIALGKRRSELAAAGDGAGDRRGSLRSYSVALIDRLTYLVAPAALTAYVIYALTAENLPGNYAMAITVPFVAYGLMRYIYLVHVRGLGESPEDLLISDAHLAATVALWLVASAVVLAVFRP